MTFDLLRCAIQGPLDRFVLVFVEIWIQITKVIFNLPTED